MQSPNDMKDRNHSDVQNYSSDEEDDPVTRYYEELCHQILHPHRSNKRNKDKKNAQILITNLDLTWGFDNYWARRMGEALLRSISNPTDDDPSAEVPKASISIRSLHVTLQHLQRNHTTTKQPHNNHTRLLPENRDGEALEESLMDFLKFIRTCKTLERITLEIGNAPVYLTCRFFLAMEANPNIHTIILKLLHRHPVGLDTLLHASADTEQTTADKRTAHVKRLELHMCTLGEESFDIVAQAIANNTSIERLELHCCMLYSAFVVPILYQLHRHTRLQHLVLSCGQARDYAQTGESIALALQHFLEQSLTIRILELSEFEFTNISQFRPIVRGVLASPTLVDLRFFGDCWFDESCRMLFEQEVRPRIRHIRIS